MKDHERFRRFMLLSKLCAICGKSEYDFGPDHQWYNCTTCHFGWCCSQEHFDDYNTNIHSQPFSFMMPESPSFRPHFPTFPADWPTLFQLRCGGDLPLNQLPPEFLPASTLKLSQVYTCLYAMYQHKSLLERFFGDDNNNSNSSSKETLTIHVVGASQTFELMPSGVWEDILHCLPRVHTFNLVFVGQTRRHQGIDATVRSLGMCRRQLRPVLPDVRGAGTSARLLLVRDHLSRLSQ